MFFLIWKNYDGEHLEDFTSHQKLNKRYTELLEKYKANDYGFALVCAIEGKLLDTRKVEQKAGNNVNKLVRIA